MKSWLARAVANTVLRGDHPGNRLARWSRWFPTAGTVDDARFQGADEPYPRHWRRFPRAWPRFDPDDAAVREALTLAIGELPRPWREVIIARDVHGRRATDVSAEQGVTPAQQVAMLNRARAMLRDRLARRFVGDAE